MNTPSPDFVRAGSLAELRAKRRLVLHGPHRPILVIYDGGRVSAVDNRCPHMGFPLERGSIQDGILTCPWHHARFDLASGCTFDLWADDVPTCPVELRAGEVWVKPVFSQADLVAHWRGRLQDGLAHNLSLVIAKAVSGQLAADVSSLDIVRQAALFGARNRDGWSTGLTILTALGHVLPMLGEAEVYLALFHGARRVAQDCDSAAPHRERAALASRPEPAVLQRWMESWTAVRHRDAAERTLLTAIAADLSPVALANLMLAAGTERAYADEGHVLDFVNKAFECLDIIGWNHAVDLLPSVVPVLVEARGAEEASAWRHPVDLITLCQEAARELSGLFAVAGNEGSWSDHATLAENLLGDDPDAIVGALQTAARAGAAPVDLSRSLAYAAALRVARFGSANEHADWETAHHVFTYANAVHQILKRIGTGSADQSGSGAAACAILHGAMAVYLARYLNIPPARLPGGEGDGLDDLPTSPEAICAALLDSFDCQRQGAAAARLAAPPPPLGQPPPALIAPLG